jgi:drug/metabolite transporter (DMT)-like permease
MNTQTQSRNGVAAIALCAILWSCAGLFIKLVNWHPLAIAGTRSVVAGLFILLIHGKPHFSFSRNQLLAAFFHCVTMITFVAANRMTTAANAILLQYSAPVYVAILGWVLLGEKPAFYDWGALVAILGGMVLFFSDDLTAGHNLGNLLGAFSAITFALFSLYMRMQKDDSPTESILISNLLTVVIGLPFCFFSPPPDLTGWLSIGALGIFQTGMALIFFSYGIKRITALTAMLIIALEPLLSPLWVYLGTGETPSGKSLAGGVIILMAVTLSSVLSSRKTEAAELQPGQ